MLRQGMEGQFACCQAIGELRFVALRAVFDSDIGAHDIYDDLLGHRFLPPVF